LEDLYLPFRPKRRTRAITARERGLQPLADVLLAQAASSPTREALAAPYVSAEKELPDADAVWAGARDIVAEQIAERPELRAAALGGKPVVAIDPGLRTGCKVVALDPRGEVKAHDTIYPHTGRESEAAAALAKLLQRAAPVDIAIGNGTAGRETELFVKKLQ